MHVQYSEKYQDTLCFSGQAHANCSKLLNVKSIFHTVKNSRASAGYSTLLNKKYLFNTVKNFRESASCSNIV